MLLPGEIKPRTVLLNSVRSIYTQFLDERDERRFIVEKNPKRIHYLLKKDKNKRGRNS